MLKQFTVEVRAESGHRLVVRVKSDTEEGATVAALEKASGRWAMFRVDAVRPFTPRIVGLEG